MTFLTKLSPKVIFFLAGSVLAVFLYVTLREFNYDISRNILTKLSSGLGQLTGNFFLQSNESEQNFPVYTYAKTSSELTHRPSDQFESLSGNETMLTILTWEARSPFARTKPWEREGIISSKKYPACSSVLSPEMRCSHIYNQRDRYRTSDAVLMNGWYLQANITDTPKLPRPPGQLWIYYNLEAPIRINMTKLSLLNGLFHFTSTYSMQSDFPKPYGPTCKHVKDSATLRSSWQRQTHKSLTRLISAKTKLVAWFCSHRNTPSKRDDYVHELMKHIPVDIYGKCGHLECLPRMDNSCYKMLNAQYKFYLSFENSFCKEYVTEKFFRLLRLDVVAVVLGSVDYSKYAPAETFLDVRNFSSPRHLADYLNFLDSRPDVYAKYLLRKRSYRPVCKPLGAPLICKICRYLHDHRGTSRSMATVDLTRFLNSTKLCNSVSEFYRNNFPDFNNNTES